ncbi:hypothetical protein HPP92_016806 [Vanilla planifolia]|uniref:Uncharacterized protein n=1 Tax=Vanilla planifolia TaxID=51239 RepID=A0A835QBK9_VANPL|nr:hypothetical protein HPP92_016806 [Vanilla planifolia]
MRLLGRKFPFLRYLTHHSSTIISFVRFPSHFYSTSTVRKPVQLPFIVHYLISSVGLSWEKALKASLSISHIRSPSKPDAVLHFLKQIGLSDVYIRRAVSRMPNLLCSMVERTLKPKVLVLQQAGFSEPEIALAISANPYFFHRNLQMKLDFLMTHFGFKKSLVKAMLIKSTFFLCSNLDKKIMPNISFLRECGLSNNQIAHIMKCNPRFITRRLDSIRNIVERAVELGFTPGSGMFYLGLNSVCRYSRISIDSKVKLLGSFGWSESDISSAILKAPHLLYLSMTKIKKKMDFLLEKAGCDLSYVVAHPEILCYSYEKRMVPRIHVLQLLKSNGFTMNESTLFYVIRITDKGFVEKYVLPYKECMPELHQVYISAVAGDVLMENHFS